jgi:hypothetical protein
MADGSVGTLSLYEYNQELIKPGISRLYCVPAVASPDGGRN